MKKVTMIVCILTMVTLVAASATEIRQLISKTVPFKIVINGKEEKFINPIVAIDGRTYAPVRELCEKLGIYLSWDELEKAVMIDTSDAMDCNDWIIYDEKGNTVKMTANMVIWM